MSIPDFYQPVNHDVAGDFSQPPGHRRQPSASWERRDLNWCFMCWYLVASQTQCVPSHSPNHAVHKNQRERRQQRCYGSRPDRSGVCSYFTGIFCKCASLRLSVTLCWRPRVAWSPTAGVISSSRVVQTDETDGRDHQVCRVGKGLLDGARTAMSLSPLQVESQGTQLDLTAMPAWIVEARDFFTRPQVSRAFC